METHHYNPSSNSLSWEFHNRLDTIVSNELFPVINDIVISHLDLISENPLKVIFNFEKVEYVTSAFIRICVSISKKVGRSNFSIVNTNPLIKKTFKIALLDSELNVE